MSRPLHASLADFAGRIGRISAILDDLKAEHIIALDLRGVANFADGFVIATARSTTHMQSLVHNLDDKLRLDGLRPINSPDAVSPRSETRWAVLDYGDIVVHLFTPEARAYYDLESLWGDAATVEWQTLVTA